MSDPAGMIDSLSDIMASYGSVLVAYSGGVDSAVVLRVAHDVVGDRAIGCIGKSPALPDAELAAALALADRHHLDVRVIETDEHLDPNYLANDADRCFHCRSHLFRLLREMAGTLAVAEIADGVHLDDQSDHVGGMAAARKFGIRSPLFEAKLTKADVRAIARDLGLSVWDKPAMACLASRIPRGTPVTLTLLSRIGQAESALVLLGLRNFRVRHHGEIARLEVADGDFQTVMARRDEIVGALRKAGYRYVTVDLCHRP